MVKNEYLLRVLILFLIISFASLHGADITLVEPADYQVYQRTSPLKGDVRVRGTISDSQAANVQMEYRIVTSDSHALRSLRDVPHDKDDKADPWRELAIGKDGDAFEATFNAPAGGWYRFELRANVAGTVIAETAIEHFGVGEIFIVAGQSNSANHGQVKQVTRTKRVSSFNGQRWQIANDPQPGASGNGGSFMPPLGDALVERFDVPIGFVACGIGATSVREWLPKGETFPNPPTIEARVIKLEDNRWASNGEAYATLVKRMKQIGPNGFRAVLWHQGESDANQKDTSRTLPGNLYREYLEKIICDSRRDIGLEMPWFVAQVSYHVPGDEFSPEIREAQASLWKDGVALEGPDSDALKGDLRENEGKGVHFSGKGLVVHSAKWAEKVAPWLEARLKAESIGGEETELLFAKRILPLLKEKCFGCHGNDPENIKAEFDMRTIESIVRGGESGVAALVPKDSPQSPLYLAITRSHDQWSAMPPKENDRLNDQQIEWIQQWIDAGAPWPSAEQLARLAGKPDKWSKNEGISLRTDGALDSDWANRRYDPTGLWAYQPVVKPKLDDPTHLTTRQRRRSRIESHPLSHPIDVLIDTKLPDEIIPADRADRMTLLRRVSFDLIGLPPTPEEIADFVNDPATEREAFEKVVERLLSSPHYGEHWARHWLDVVRYADSSGFANDYERGNAWRYRDYVVRSFNEDKPYDQFIREQVAGDEIADSQGDEKTLNSELLVATGFLRMGPWELTGMEVPKIARQRFLDDVTNSVGETFLSHSLQCARCHDHKFDPIPTHDYYSIQACFSSTQLSERPASFLSQENVSGFDERKYLIQRQTELTADLQQLDEVQLAAAIAWYAVQKIDVDEWTKGVAAARAFVENGGKANKRKGSQSVFDIARNTLQKRLPEDQVPPKGVGFSPDDFGRERVARKGLERLKWELDRYEPFAFAVYSGRTPEMKSVLQPQRIPENRMSVGELEETAILGGGDPFSPTTKVKPASLSVLAHSGAQLAATIPDSIQGRRMALADWIANSRNPLTTRSIVNRIWMWHFGQPIAGNPNNFGSTGKKPTHPELLDWLASTFVEEGWSFKAMHRTIMRSDAYQRSARIESSNTNLSRDELELTYAVFKPRRLTAEEFRDAMLRTSGELNPKLGGIPNRPEINLEAALQPRQVMGTFAAAWVPNPLPEQRHRRSLYALKTRGQRDPFMEVFNEPGPDFSCETRELSTVTPQVFSLFNGQASCDRALALANRVVKEKTDDNRNVQRLFQLTYGRSPTSEEERLTIQHWNKMTAVQSKLHVDRPAPPLNVIREAVEENTGEKFTFHEKLDAYADFVPDLQPSNVDARTRALADICLALFNSNEFAFVY